MKLTLSWALPSRQFDRASRPVRTEFIGFEHAFEALDLSTTPVDGIDILIDGGGDDDQCVVVTGEARRFNMTVGLGVDLYPDELRARVARSIAKALALAPFEGSDRETATTTWLRWWDETFPGTQRPSDGSDLQPSFVRFEDLHKGLAALHRCTTPVAAVFERYAACISGPSDVLHAYAEWRAAGKKAYGFLDWQLAAWEIRVEIPAYPERMVKRMVEQGGLQLSIHDDAVISTALAQLIVDAKLLPSVGTRARICVDRQLMPAVMASRDGGKAWAEALAGISNTLPPARQKKA